MIDTVHEHECLIFLFGFNVQFISSLTYSHSYVLAVCWYVLRVDFMCPTPYFYICVICNKHCVNNLFVDDVQNSFSQATRNCIRENCGYTLNFAPDRMQAGRRL